MALLRTVEQWTHWMSDLGFDQEEIKKYATAFAAEEISEEDVPEFDHALLTACKVLKYGHRTKIIRKARASNVNNISGASHPRSNKAVEIPRPSIHKGITQVEYDHFLYEWQQFKKHYNFQSQDEVETQLTFCCSKDIRGKIREGKTSTNAYTEEQLLQVIQDIALSKVSRMTNIKKFFMIKQEDTESCEDYYSRLQTMATCCKFDCKHCGKSNISERVREKFVLG